MNRPTAICLSVLALLLFCSCASAPANNGQQNTNTANISNSQASPNDNVEELRSSIQVPVEPEEVAWRIVSDKDGRKRLTAVLRLKPEDFKALSVRASAPGPGKKVEASVEQWFPAELTTMGETSGEMTIEGKALPATEFFQPPYTSGSAVLIPDTNYLILDLQAN